MKKKLLFQLMLAMMTIMAVTSASAQDCVLGTVYNDLDLDCVQDPGEPGIPGVTMVLISSTGVVVEQVTNDTGFYLFCGSLAGDYILLTQTGSPNLEPNPATQTVTVPVGQSIVDVDVCVTDLSLLGVIAGSAFIDLNDNGLRDIFEPCLVDFPVTLEGNSGQVTINTDAQGMFRFTRLPSDDYVVSMVANIPNTEWVSGPSFPISLTPGQIINNVRFVRRPSLGFGSIIDVICFDLNADGLNNPATEPPLGGITVQLLNLQGQVLATSVSDSKGVYSFIGIAPGEYRVQALFNPEDYTPTTPTSYDVILPVNEFRRPGPFYGQPLRKIFKCGMAVSTFGSEAHGDQVVSVKDIRDRSGAPAVSSGTAWSPLDLSSLNWKDTNLGEVFGIAIDPDFNVYLTAATIPTYSASFVVNNNEPLIYRIDPYTGSIFDLTFETNGATTVGNSAINTGTAGLGNICSDGGDLLFVTNMSNGTIVVVGDANHPTNPGDVLQVYPVTSFPAASMAVRDLWGIGYNKADGRLYFSSPPSSGTIRIYSIPVVGGVILGSELLEFTVSGTSFNDIADIAFSQDGQRMLLAERGDPHQARVLQYAGSSGAWGPPQEIFVGGYWQGRNSAGGVDYAHESFAGDMPPFVECEPFLATSGNALNYPSPAIYGYGITPASGNLQPGNNYPPNAADFTGLNSILIDNDVNTIFADKFYQGDVEVFDCPCRFDDGCDVLFDLEVIPSSSINGHCCVILDYQNNGSETVYGVELVGLDGVTFNNTYTPGPGLITPNFGANNVTFVPAGFVPMPAATTLVSDLCFENVNAMPEFFLVNYLDSAYQVFCTDTIPVFCEPEQTCLSIVSDSLVCDSLGYKYIVTVTNPAAATFPVTFIKFNITPPIPGVTYIPDPPEFILADTLFPGDTTMLMFWIQTNQDLYGDSLCFILSAHDGPEERLCCAEIDTCIAFPLCDPCPYVDADIIPYSDIQVENCCYELIITDTFTLDPALFQSVQTTILTPGVTFSGLVTLPALLDGWNVTHLVSNMDLLWTHNSGMVPNDIGYNLFDFCVEGTTSTDSIYIAINWIGADSTVICTDTLAIYCPFCLTVVNDSLTCLTTVDANGVVTQEYIYTFQVQNFSPFPVNTIGIVEIPSGNTDISPDVISIPTIPAFPPGGTSIPISITIDGSAGPISDFCFDIVLRQVILDSIDITCCYATHCIDLPPCDSLPDFRCPDPALVNNIPCTLEFLPVCGCDDVTYSNVCQASNAGVTIWTPGVCNMLIMQDPRLNLQATLTEGGAVLLDWSLFAEQGFDFFALEKLYDGGVSKVIATLRFDGGQVKYDYLDTEATAGVNSYRVAASNSRGVPIYSNVAEIFVQEINGNDIALRTYPVPASQQLFVASSKSGICDISIVSPEGIVFPAKQFNLSGAPVTLDLNTLPAGAYSVRLQYGDGVVVQQRFVKVE